MQEIQQHAHQWREEEGGREGGGDGEVLQTAMFFMALNAGMDTFRIML